MTEAPGKTFRVVQPKLWSLSGTVALTGLAVVLGGPAPVAAETKPQTDQAAAATEAGKSGEAGESGESGAVVKTSEAGEGGEAGEGSEGAVSTDDAEVDFLVHLGLFEASVRIVAGLYAEGQPAMALEHLDASHHADYEDIEDALADLGLPRFEDDADAFADAVRAGAPADGVAALADAVLARIDAALAQSGIDAGDRLVAIQHLLKTAAADFDGGTDAGEIVLAQEYRDAWGFAGVAARWTDALRASPDADTARAAADLAERLAPVAALFPGVAATRAGADPSVLHGAAGWAEIIAMRLN